MWAFKSYCAWVVKNEEEEEEEEEEQQQQQQQQQQHLHWLVTHKS